MWRLAARSLALLTLAAAAVLGRGAQAQSQYSYGQATYYNSISHGFCGFGSDIPANGFVAAWPFIETDPRTGAGYAQPGGGECGACMEVSCVPQYVESADGSIYLDRRDACADPNRAIIVKVVDECRCSLPRDSNLPRGNFNWCCNTPTPQLKIDRHIDLSQQAFTALVKGGDYGLGIIGIRYRRVACDNIGVVQLANGSQPSGAPQALQGQQQPAAASTSTPAKPSNPPEAKTWHDAVQTQDDKGASQSLPLFSQCGGRGGACGAFGGEGQCRDQPFVGYSCAAGLSCRRQDEFYSQCLNDAGGSNTTGSGQPPLTLLREVDQCGGKGARCQEFGMCADNPFPRHVCGSGLLCSRQNKWYWECIKAPGAAQAAASDNANAGGSAAADTSKRSSGSKATGKKSKQGPPRKALLKAVDQCGGKGAKCNEFGSGACADKPFPGYVCASGLKCKRQNEWWWECI